MFREWFYSQFVIEDRSHIQRGCGGFGRHRGKKYKEKEIQKKVSGMAGWNIAPQCNFGVGSGIFLKRFSKLSRNVFTQLCI